MSDTPESQLAPEEQGEGEQWSRRQFIWGTTGLVAAGAVALFGRPAIVSAARGIFGSPVDSKFVHVYQQDFYFVPNYMTWKVGDHMTLRLHNMSPYRYHEMQLGRHVSTESTIFGTLTADGFTEDFWQGVPVTASNPFRIDNFVPNKAVMTFVGNKAQYQLATGGGFSPTLKPGGHINLTFTVPNKPGIWHYG